MSELPGPEGAIVYIGNFELPDRNAAAHRVRGNARIFRDLGYRVILVGVTRTHSGSSWLETADSGEEDIEAYHIPYPVGAREWFTRIGSNRVLKEVIAAAGVEQLAMTICYNYPAISQFRIAAETRRLGGLAVADCTEWYAQLRNDSLASLVKNLDTPLRMHWVNRAMDAMVTTSPFITEYYRSTGMPIVELPTIIPLSKPATFPAAEGREHARLVFAGSGFDPALALKGKEGLKDRLDWVLELLLVAHRAGARFVIDLYGVTREDYLVLVPSHAALLDELDTSLQFHGRVPHADLLETLMCADFSIFMRKATRVTMAGFASKFSESISYGTPAITNRLPSTERYMREGLTGFFLDPGQPEASGARLAQILSMSRAEIDAMKAWCAQSRMFEHVSFVEPVADWMAALARLPASQRGRI